MNALINSVITYTYIYVIYMIPVQFEGNTQYMRYEYHRVREGANYFVSYYKHSSLDSCKRNNVQLNADVRSE